MPLTLGKSGQAEGAHRLGGSHRWVDRYDTDCQNRPLHPEAESCRCPAHR